VVPQDDVSVTTKEKEKKNRGFEKVCIVVWRDADELSFQDIRGKLENAWGWVLLVRREYERARERARERA
jgi:hypothetical protein